LEIETNDVRLSFPPKRPAEALARLGGALRAERTRESADFRRVFSAEKIEYNHIMFSAPREPPRKHESVFRAGANRDETTRIFGTKIRRVKKSCVGRAGNFREW
jgi:hypothetical protein